GSIDDALFADLMNILDIAEMTLKRTGFQVVFETTNAILGAMMMAPSDIEPEPDEGARADAERQASREAPELRRALTVAVELRDTIAHRASPDERVHINICIHRARALFRPWADQRTIAGG